jgi:uncharacterized tellurite resistance protein B-like protein
MLIISTMDITRTRERGVFYCPNCRENGSYCLRARRPFLTLYFIPTVPVGPAEEFVLCDQCQSRWDTSVLSLNQRDHEQLQEEEFRDQAFKCAILVTLADGMIEEVEIDGLLRIANDLLQRDTDREELGQLCSTATQNRVTPENYSLTISSRWSTSQRRRALQAMFLAASATGTLSDTKLTLLARMREILKLTEEEYQSAIIEVIEQA